MPVLVLSDDVYPALGGELQDSLTLNSVQASEKRTMYNSCIFLILNFR
jgi:hypothetical protein